MSRSPCSPLSLLPGVGLILSTLLLACGSPASTADAGPSASGASIGAHCTANSDCASNQCDTALGSLCVSSCGAGSSCPSGATCALPGGDAGSLCLPSCTSNGDCSSGYDCNAAQGVCLPSGSMGATDAGNTGCQTTGCATGKTCDTTTGQCVSSSTGCTSTSCGTGETCDTTTGQCVSSSTGCTSTSCGTGETCDTTTGQCVAAACTSTSCTGGQTCDTTTGQCVTPVATPLTNTGATCASVSDCVGGSGTQCLPAASPSYFVGGYCTANCMLDTDCGTGGICVSDFFVGSTGMYASQCAQSCVSAGDCRTGYVCAPDGTQSFCLPNDCRVDVSLCTWEQTCNQSTGVCGAPAVTTGYPATFPAVPQVVNAGGPVLATPQIVAIFFSNDTEAANLAQFYTGYPKTQLWAGLSQYGVGAATTTIVNLAQAAPTTIDDSGANSAMEKWLLNAINTNLLPPASANTEYMINYPATTTVTSDGESAGGAGCDSYGGYHVDMKNGTSTTLPYLAYGVLPRCPALDGFTVDQNFSASASHEVVEAATDPYPNYDPAWAEADDAHIYFDEGNGGSEVGDMCENDPEAYYIFPDLPFVVQRFWSNESVAAGHDPCVPYYDGETFFNAVPVAPDMITFKYEGVSDSVGGTEIAVGASATVTLDLYSDAPTAAWNVAVEDYNNFFLGNTALLTITNPAVTTGQNGAQLQFTVKVDTKGAASNGNVAGTELFVVDVTQGTGANEIEHFWFGVIGQQ